MLPYLRPAPEARNVPSTATPHLTPKGKRADHDAPTGDHPDFTYANKVPGAGRPFPTHTNLGRVMNDKGLRAYQLAGQAEVSNRTLTEYLAGRKRIPDHHLFALAKVLGVEATDLL